MKNIETWYQATGHCATSEYEVVSYLFFEAGVSMLQELDSSNAERTDFCFFSESKEERDRIIAQFPQYEFTRNEEPAKDWDLWWRERAVPVSVSKRLWVRPPWVAFESEDPEAVILELEAKTAFGTGEHATTALVASLMEQIPMEGKTVLDIGTGTGILAMFAKRLGAKIAIGTEIDPLALPCIAENFAKNGFKTSGAVLGFLDIFREEAHFDVIVCNMIRSELWPLRDDIESRLLPRADLILSGQLTAEKDYILNWFTESGFVIEAEASKEEWWGVHAKRI
ncbi:MAG: 50S ribosomal protein L11 methyltransferase [Fibrobacteres bacterium CG2_30_45_31]|nr:MAG: 50S ribosomal protein L11 methyltransferase [Fibrobacteres bacterium CG2_30_45_31]